MRILPWTIFAGAVVGNDLHTATVSGSLLGVRAKAGPILRDFLTLPPDEGRRLLGEIPDAASLVLIIPSSMVGVRPTALPPARWPSARDEMLKSIESLFPFPAAESVVGFIGRRLNTGDSAGYLIAADRRTIQPWIDSLRRIIPRPIDAVISSHMALLGTGHQRTDSAELIEWTGSQWSAHRLAWGEITELNGTPSADNSEQPTAVPSDRAPSTNARTMSGGDLAAAGALASIVAPNEYAPLIGSHAHPPRRWLPAAAAIILGGVLLWSVGRVEDWRYDRGVARLQQTRATQESTIAQLASVRERTLDLIARLESVKKAFTGTGPGALSAVDAAQSAVPPDAFLYRVEVDPSTVTVKGEAKRAGDVLRALEDSAAFQGARDLDTPVTVEERGLEMFNIRAERAKQESKGGEGK